MSRTLICVTGIRGIPGVIGGIEAHCEELLPRIAALAPELEIEVVGRRRFVDPKIVEFKGVAVKTLPSPAGINTEAVGATFLGVLYARKRRAAIVHIHAIGPALLAPLARALGLRVVITHHGADYERARWGSVAKLVLRLGERWGVSSANQIIAVAPSLAARLRTEFPSRADAIHYIPNGAAALEDSEPAEDILKRFGLDSKGYILGVGRLVPEKGFDYLIRAFRASGSDRKLALVGGPTHQSGFARDLLRQADDRVVFLGPQPRPVLRRLYEQADLFVLPSFHEGLAISALEAANCATPMLLSDIAANRDIGLPPGNYFPVGNERALAELLARPAQDFAYDVAEVTSRFNWDRIAEQTLAVYRKLLSSAAAVDA
ncbi:MAG: glycosyltransferase family 4 protein [Sphingomicrobium sp.]